MLARTQTQEDFVEISGSSIDPADLRRIMGRFATGVAVIAADTPRGLIGLTVSSFNTVSLDPPLILFSAARTLFGLEPLLNTQAFSVNILALDQVGLSNRFARAGADKWTDTAFVRTREGAPALEGALATFVCEHHGQHDGGDHVIVVGRIVSLIHGIESESNPLLFYRGRYHAVGKPL